MKKERVETNLEKIIILTSLNICNVNIAHKHLLNFKNLYLFGYLKNGFIHLPIKRLTMINKKLEEFGRYANDLEKEKPIDLLKNYINQINEELKSTDEVQSEIEVNFGNEIIQLINNYKEKEISNSIISINLFNVLVNFIKNSLIEQKASDLEIDRTLYKQEMRILFKGKWK